MVQQKRLACFPNITSQMPLKLTDNHVSNQLNKLRDALSNLPKQIPSIDGQYYPFASYHPDDEWVESTGSLQGALNHALEVTFGNRSERVSAGHMPVEFDYQGPDLLALVDVFTSHI